MEKTTPETPLTPCQAQLAESHMKLVSSIASHYLGNGILFEDLVGDGYVALCLAARNYDQTRDNEFTTYATPYIEGYIYDIVHRSRIEHDLLASLTPDDLYAPSSIDSYNEHDFLDRIKPLTQKEQFIIKSIIGIGEPHRTRTELALLLHCNRHTITNFLKKALAKINNNQNNATPAP